MEQYAWLYQLPMRDAITKRSEKEEISFCLITEEKVVKQDCGQEVNNSIKYEQTKILITLFFFFFFFFSI